MHHDYTAYRDHLFHERELVRRLAERQLVARIIGEAPAPRRRSLLALARRARPVTA